MKQAGSSGFQKKSFLLTKLRNTNDNNEGMNGGNSWQVEGARALQKEHRDTFENSSIKHIPINLPKFESEVYDATTTIYSIPISVKIKLKKGIDQSLNHSRWLVAIIKALQMVHHDTYIGVLTGNSISEKIVHHDQVPLDHRRLYAYMVEPVLGTNKSYSTKIIIHANNDLNSYLSNPTLLLYLAKELITIEHNNLSTTTPMNVGFIEQVTASRETTQLHKMRLDSFLPKNAPDFQVCVYRVYGSDKKISQFVMIQSDKKDIATLTEMLIEINDDTKLVFFPWSVFVKAPSLERQSVVDENRKWNNLFHSVVVDGFIDNDDNNKMNLIEDTSDSSADTSHPNMLVSEYLQNLLHPITKNTMFDYVYPSCMGKREFIISNDNFGDIENYLALLIGELAREMSIDSIIAEFCDSEYAISQSKRGKWKPFSRVFVLTETPKVKQINTSNTNKRSRLLRDNEQQHKPAIVNTITTPSRVTPGISFLQKTTNQIPVLNPYTTIITPKNDQEVIVLRGQVLRLESTVSALSKSMQQPNNETNSKIDKLEENLSAKYSKDLEILDKNQNDTINSLFERMCDKFDSSIDILSVKIENNNNTPKVKPLTSNTTTPRQQSLRSNNKSKRSGNELGSDLDDTDNDMDVSKENIDTNMANQITNK
jgi:hypothetical protein